MLIPKASTSRLSGFSGSADFSGTQCVGAPSPTRLRVEHAVPEHGRVQLTHIVEVLHESAQQQHHSRAVSNVSSSSCLPSGLQTRTRGLHMAGGKRACPPLVFTYVVVEEPHVVSGRGHACLLQHAAEPALEHDPGRRAHSSNISATSTMRKGGAIVLLS